MLRTAPLAAALMLTVAAGVVVTHGGAATQAVARPVRVGFLNQEAPRIPASGKACASADQVFE
jgi:hypothetical protein